jgi:DNA topoisomerase-1
MAFVSSNYWDLIGTFARQSGAEFEATLVSVDGRRIPRAKNFDTATGEIKDKKLMLLDEQAVRDLAAKLTATQFQVTALDVKPFTERPKAPFTTSTLQQEANRKLNFTARRTMNAAQSLYENGLITYMRTDSTTLADVAIKSARDLVRSEYGDAYVHDAPRVYASKVKNAQEAHEAIRPAGSDFPTPASLKSQLKVDELKLYDLIWKRTVASQMTDAKKRRITITIEGGGAVFQVSGTTIDFEGFLRAYVEGSDDPEAELADQETLLPAVEQGEVVLQRRMEPKGHTTQPPARYSEATLTRTLEERGIGRPSTYASIVETIQARDYVFKKGNALVPSWTAFSVVRLLEEHFPSLVDYEFTAQMEDFLDSISRQEVEHIQYLNAFYFGNGKPGLKQDLKSKETEIDPRRMSRFLIGTPTTGEHREEVVLRVGKYGPFLEQGERKASLPDGMCPDELTLTRAIELLDESEHDDEPLGTCSATQRPVYLKQGRFGPYVQLGTTDDEEKPKNASLLNGMKAQDVTLEVALKLLSLPRPLGEHPEMKETVEAFNGRYGPYVKCGSETRSLPAEWSPLEVTLEQAIQLLAQPKTGGRGRAAPKAPIKTFDKSPVTNEPVNLLEGRYGPYVTDGTTNASIPRGTSPDDVTFAHALQMLAERAARAPAKKKKKVTKKKVTKKKAAKKTTKKTPAKKKAAKKTGKKKSR